MFGSMKKHIDNPSGDIETIIGGNTSIIGKIKSEGNVRIDGHIGGDVEAVGDVVIGESGTVEGDIKARGLIIAGTVTGNVGCSENLNIHATGQLIGDVRVRSLIITDGGVFRGRSEMDVRSGGVSQELAPVG